MHYFFRFHLYCKLLISRVFRWSLILVVLNSLILRSYFSDFEVLNHRLRHRKPMVSDLKVPIFRSQNQWVWNYQNQASPEHSGNEQFTVKVKPKKIVHTNTKKTLTHCWIRVFTCKNGSLLLSRIALQYHRRKRASPSRVSRTWSIAASSCSGSASRRESN